MKLELTRASVKDAGLIWKMQIEAFAELLEKYQDTDTNPGSEPLEDTVMRLEQQFTYYYIIKYCDEIVGAIRVLDDKKGERNKGISPLFVLKQYRNKGIAQEAIREVERIHGDKDWELDTVEEEAGNCYLYEKMGYSKLAGREAVNERLTLVMYRK